MSLLTEAFALAAEKHRDQKRKIADIPFLTHPLAVAALVLQYGGSERQAAAALVHDLLDVLGPQELERRLGAEVASIVLAFADPELPPGSSRDWTAQKAAYVGKLRELSEEQLLVVACEELHELKELLHELRYRRQEAATRATAPLINMAWYYRELLSVFVARLHDSRARALATEFASDLKAFKEQVF